MGKRCLAVIVFLLLLPAAAAAAPSQVRISVFNFGAANIEASGLGATVTNMLIGQLGEGSTMAILDRKELESFLSMNDLQQNDNIDNVVNIGTRLGLNVIVIGTVDKRGSMINVQCRAIQIDQKKPILTARASAIGDAALAQEIRKLSQQIRTAIADQVSRDKTAAEASFPAPGQVSRRPGNRSIQLNWEEAPGGAVAGYEVFRAIAEAGPFSRLAQTTRPEYLDETVEKDTPYFYKIRAYNDRGLQSEFSAVVEAKTAVTPNPPVILKTEGHIRGIELLWSPGPRSEDPEPLKGYRLYRSKSEQGPYREMVNIESKGLGEVTAALDRLLKVPYLDKGLEDGQEYYYRVTAYNDKGLESGFSRSVKGTTTPAVGAVAAEGNFIREIRLAWNAIDSPFIRGYHVYRSAGGKGSFARIKRIDVSSSGGTGRKIEYADRDGLADLTRYDYRITAFEEGDSETSPSPVASAVTRGKPATPEGFKALGGLVKKVELTWKASTAEDVEGYRLFWSKTREGEYQHLKTLAGRATDRYTDSARGFDKLEDGTEYYYRLVTYNRVDVDSEATPVASAKTKPRPTRPTGLAGEAAKVKSVPLRWSANPEKDIAVYHLFRSASAEGGEFERVTKVPGSDYLDAGLKDNTPYRYRLQAEDKDGLLSDFSDVITVRTKPRPAKLDGVSGQVREGKAVLSWKASPEADIVHYTVYEKKLFGMEKITTVKETQFSETAPLKGKTKTYLVTATDKDGLEGETGQEIPITGP